jgi:uncharacterized protein (TIGR02453 family)
MERAKIKTVTDAGGFGGFSPGAVRFLEQLRKNNNRDWFAPRKGEYEAELKRPMERLVNEVSAGCQTRGFVLLPKQPSPVTRIYRDTRFFPEKGPFHHFVGGMLVGKQPVGEMYIHVSPEGCFTAAGFYMPAPEFLKAVRERIASRPETIIGMVGALRRKKLDLVDEWKLARMPRGFEPFASGEAAAYLKLKCFIARRMLGAGEIASPALVKTLVKFALDAQPLLEWGWSFVAAKPRAREFDF